MIKKIIVAYNPDNLPTAKYTDFIDLQGDLKTLPKENQEKLKNSIQIIIFLKARKYNCYQNT